MYRKPYQVPLADILEFAVLQVIASSLVDEGETITGVTSDDDEEFDGEFDTKFRNFSLNSDFTVDD